jgi:predicted amidohydrolase
MSVRVALLQIESGQDESPADRTTRVIELVRAVASGQHPSTSDRKPDLIALPELWQAGAFAVDNVLAIAAPAGAGVESAMSEIAREHNVFIHAGSLAERLPDGGVANSAVVFDGTGTEIARYRKIHLFGFDEGEAVLLTGGDELVVVDTPLGRTGIATCYDLRFPEQFRGLIDTGATSILLVSGWPSVRVLHWDVLTQARAIEEQVWFIACNGVGSHANITLAGHSRVIDPMGAIVAVAGENQEVLVADIEPDRVNEVRTVLPVLRDRRLGIDAPPSRNN